MINAPPPSGLTQAEFDAQIPPPLSLAFAGGAFRAVWEESAQKNLAAALVPFAWPWLSLATLLVFRASKRRADVNTRHLARAVVYACDSSLAPVAAAAVFVAAARQPPISEWVERWIPSYTFGERAPLIAVAIAACAAVSTYRLSIAAGQYLRFHRPLATVIASQLIAVLAAIGIAFFARLGRH